MDLWHLWASSKSSSNYPGLSFTGGWHDPEAPAGLANCVSDPGLRMIAASSLSSWLITGLHASEHTPHLTWRGTLANWELFGSSELLAEVGRALRWASPSSKSGIRSQFVNYVLPRCMDYAWQFIMKALFLPPSLSSPFSFYKEWGKRVSGKKWIYNIPKAQEFKLIEPSREKAEETLTYSVQILFCL